MRGSQRIAVAALATAIAVGAAMAQTKPAPGPTKPPPTASPLEKPGTNMVTNLTADECRAGRNAGLKWTKEQFEESCARMKEAK